ncbi:MAG: hypothetical protein ACO363_06220, partial [Balneolaceae bacterium]
MIHQNVFVGSHLIDIPQNDIPDPVRIIFKDVIFLNLKDPLRECLAGHRDRSSAKVRNHDLLGL